MKTGGMLLVELMEMYGIEVAFGIPGTHNIELYRGLENTDIAHYLPRHEQGAGFMADGYARLSGKVAACFTVSGPGALNIATAMGQALQDSVPMLVISADNNSWTRGLSEGRLHETQNLQSAMEQVSIWAHTIQRVDEIPNILGQAFCQLNHGRVGPVHLSVPLDVMKADASHVLPKRWDIPLPPAPNTDAMALAADRLNGARRPVITLGGGAVPARKYLKELAEKIQAPVTLTQNARGIFPPDFPLLVKGAPFQQAIREYYQNADVVLAIGTQFSETDYDFTLSDGVEINGALIRIDIDRRQLVRNVPADIAIHADSTAAVPALIKRLQKVERPPPEDLIDLNKSVQPRKSETGYRLLFDAIQSSLDDVVVFMDPCQPTYYAMAHYFPPNVNRVFASTSGYCTLGYAPPAAFGAAAAGLPNPIVAIVGDGGSQFTLGELAAAAEQGLAVAVIIWNNNGYAEIAQNFLNAKMEPQGCDLPAPDFVKLAQAYGCAGYRASNAAELSQHLQKLPTAKTPVVILIEEQDFLKQP